MPENNEQKKTIFNRISDVFKSDGAMQKEFKDYIKSFPLLLKWLLISIGVGLVVGLVGTIFGHTLTFVNELRVKYPLIILTLPIGGLLIVFVNRVCKNSDDKGTNTIVASIQESTEIPFKMAPLIFFSTTITHLCGGSAGREGAAIQLGGSIAKRMGRLMNLTRNNQRTITMCGMSAGFSALFGTPVAAAVFSMEVVNVGIMHYAAFVPCVISAYVARFVADYFKLHAEHYSVLEIPAFTPYTMMKILVFAAVVAGVSILFCIVLRKTEHVYEKYIKNQYIRIFTAGCIIIVLSLILQTGIYLGPGTRIIEQVFHTGNAPWYTFLLKILFTALTLGAGFKGGEIVPSFCIGSAFGCAVAGLLGMPATLVAACGMVGVFCGVTNSPIASLLIALELFGYEGMPYYLMTVAVSYMLSGYESLYFKQKIMYSKTQTSYVMYGDGENK